MGQEGLGTPNIPNMDHPLVTPLLEKFVDVFGDPFFLLDIYVIHDIYLIDPMA